MRKISRTEQHLQDIQRNLADWNSFVRRLDIPAEIAPAITTGRLELLSLAVPRPLSAEECGVLYRLIGGLLETNQALQQHSAKIADMAGEVSRTIYGIQGVVDRLASYADFQTPDESAQDDD